MRVEIISEAEKGLGLKLVPESESEQQQIRDLKVLGVEAKVQWVELYIRRRRLIRQVQQLAFQDVTPAED